MKLHQVTALSVAVTTLLFVHAVQANQEPDTTKAPTKKAKKATKKKASEKKRSSR